MNFKQAIIAVTIALVFFWALPILGLSWSLLVWSDSLDQSSAKVVMAVEKQTMEAQETNRAIVRLTDRMDTLTIAQTLLRDRVVALEQRANHVDEHIHGEEVLDAGEPDN